ncbi:anti-phage ZorAB system protein ZorA [Methylorubrum extorquens]|uniref:MotA/TolQ/ExbB proton channel domain-containing protein n=1 Tax=Methylorubrum extorquens (strain CM4 / NCIMB 13688) TaxID=440085 RepID=B7KTS9_METC4|nr:anti-phage ZorAB system protein ZorA [Methylorubrum extorquens]ACK84139.1 hypothetical protein Mchl_3304 [Methylorubrum extorquens CM4]
MFELVLGFGIAARDAILAVAGLLKSEAVPGLIAVALVLALAFLIVLYARSIAVRVAAVRGLRHVVRRAADEASFGQSIADLDAEVLRSGSRGARKQIATAWDKYRETLVEHDEDGAIILRNSVRPAVFFNADDLGFGSGFWRAVPGLFVTIGLFLTFLGLISALGAMDLSAPDKVQSSLRELLLVASAKFIMSLTGLLCSIVFTVVLRWGIGSIEGALHTLCAEIEKRLSFISLENLAAEQLRATREQREHFRLIGLELVAELGRPLREEIPAAISASINATMGPLLQQVGQLGTDHMGSMVKDLSARFSDDVGRALAQASERLVQAGDRIGELSTRMDQSSGRMGSEMDAAVARLAQAVDDLRDTMSATAASANGAFTDGADRLLGAMNQTLQEIRDNTRAGAEAMGAAAADMRGAAEGFRTELEAATRSGATEAAARMQAAGSDASAQISAAGSTVVQAFGRTAGEIAEATREVGARAAQDLLAPLDSIAGRLRETADGVAAAVGGVGRLGDGVRASAEAAERAAGAFRGSSEALITASAPLRATTERIESSIRQLADATQHVAGTVSRSAEQTARSAADALAAAQTALGGHAGAIEASLAGVGHVVDRLKGQGAQLDTLDEKLGAAFDVYAARVATAVDTLSDYVRRMQSELAPALDTLRAVVEQAEQFIPESRVAAGRRGP